jgi:outer membrane protease
MMSRRALVVVVVSLQTCALAGSAGPAPTVSGGAAWERGVVTHAPRLELSCGVGALAGHTTYRVGGRTELADGTTEHLAFPISELEFPLNVALARLDGRFLFGPGWEMYLGAARSITSDAGILKDSDWGVYFDWNSLDIYSESDATTDAAIMDGGVRRRFVESGTVALWAGLGYLRQTFNVEGGHLHQWYPSSGPFAPHDVVPGRVIEYEVTYSIPYIEFGARTVLQGGLHIDAAVSGSPLVAMDDEDDHLLRSKRSKSESDGVSVAVRLELSCALSQNWSATMVLSGLALATEGTQDQYIDGVYQGRIEQESRSDQAQAVAALTYGF